MVICSSCGTESAEGARFCSSCGRPLSDQTAPPRRERRVVSVLFCDLVGFTASSELADPEEVQARVTPYYQRVRRELESYGGTVEKFIGDAVVAVFGAPVAHEDDAERAIRAGLAVLDAIHELNNENPGLALSVRVGVNTGEVVFALDDRPERGDAMVLGDVVNTASRIQSGAPPGAVAVGEATYRATARVFDYLELEPVAAKGKAAPVAIWRPLAALARYGRDVLRTLTRPLVGRDLELLQLRTVFDRVALERAVQLVTIVGEPGVGKSRLVAELSAYVNGLEQQVTWREGRCPPYGEGITFWALGEIVKSAAGIYESDSSEVATAKLEAVLPKDQDRPWLLARLLPLLGIASGPSDQKELFAAWRRFLEAIAERAPMVVVFEDIHWAGEAMLAFVEHLADWVNGVPMLLVCTARPELYEAHPGWGAGLANHLALRLTPLSDADTSRLLSMLLDRATLPTEIEHRLLERSGGNPLYAEEFVRLLKDGGLLDDSGTLKPGADLPLPDSLQALIAARLDTLPDEGRQLLQNAAVIGRVFWTGAVAAASARDLGDVEAALHGLARQELVRHARSSSMEGEIESSFWHLLIRDVAYSQIPRAERAAKHQQTAAWLESKARGRIEDLADVLAYHTGEALSLAKALGDQTLAEALTPAAAKYTLLAGERALGLDTQKAIEYLDRARSLLSETDPRFPAVLLRWAMATHQAGRFRDAEVALELAINRFQEAGEVVQAGEALALLSTVRRRLGEPGWMVSAEHAVGLLGERPGPELVAALADLAYAHLADGSIGPAVEYAKRSLTLAEAHGLPMPGGALGVRGFGRCSEGDPAGLNEIEKAIPLLMSEGKGRDVVVMHGLLAKMSWFQDGPMAALTAHRTTESLARDRGLEELASVNSVNAIEALLHLGRFAEALSLVDPVEAALSRSGERLFLGNLRTCQAIALWEMGRDSRAPAEESMRIARHNGIPLFLTFAACAAAGILAHDDPDSARVLLDEVANLEGQHDPVYALDLQLARVAAQLGDPDLVRRLSANVPDMLPIQQHARLTARALQLEAGRALEEAAIAHGTAAARWERFGDVLEQAHALQGQARCLIALGDPDGRAVSLAAKALWIKMGADRRVAECDALLAG